MEIAEVNETLAAISSLGERITQRSEVLRANSMLHAVSVWSNEQRNIDDQHSAVCEHICANNDSDVLKLSNSLRQYQEAKAANSLDEMKFSQDMDDIVERLTGLTRKNVVFPTEHKKLLQEISAKSERLEQRRAQADQLLRRNKRTESKLTDVYNDYQQAFAVHVKSIDNKTIQFMFKKIKKSDPDALYTVSVTVNGEKYSAKACDPMIPNFDRLSKELDVTNKLEPFLRAVRKGFREVAAE